MGGYGLVLEDVFPCAEEQNLLPLMLDFTSKHGAAFLL